MFIKSKTVQPAKDYTYKRKKGYLLLELVVGLAVASIMLVCVWSSFSTAINLDTKVIEKEKSFKILCALEKEFSRNVKFEDILNLAGEKKVDKERIKAKKLINIDFIENKVGSLDGIYMDFSEVNNKKISINIYKDEYKIEVDKLECVGIR